jgi:hypothetical protein
MYHEQPVVQNKPPDRGTYMSIPLPEKGQKKNISYFFNHLYIRHESGV